MNIRRSEAPSSVISFVSSFNTSVGCGTELGTGPRSTTSPIGTRVQEISLMRPFVIWGPGQDHTPRSHPQLVVLVYEGLRLSLCVWRYLQTQTPD